MMTKIGLLLQESWIAKIVEIVAVFGMACLLVFWGWKYVGDDHFARQVVVWVANVIMLIIIWFGLWLRGQALSHFGFSFKCVGFKRVGIVLLQSLLVFILAIVAFVLGGMLVANVGNDPQQADMSSYDYLQGNLPMLLLSLAAVYVVSSFGEEMIYRGFLINRIRELFPDKKWAWPVAVVCSALIFGLVHFGWGIVGIVQTTLMGLVLGGSYLVVKRNLWVLVLAHVYIDTLLLVQLYF